MHRMAFLISYHLQDALCEIRANKKEKHIFSILKSVLESRAWHTEQLVHGAFVYLGVHVFLLCIAAIAGHLSLFVIKLDNFLKKDAENC